METLFFLPLILSACFISIGSICIWTTISDLTIGGITRFFMQIMLVVTFAITVYVIAVGIVSIRKGETTKAQYLEINTGLKYNDQPVYYKTK